MKRHTGIWVLMILISLSCKEKEIDPLSLSDRQRALRSIGYELIVPSFVTLQTASNKLVLETMKYRGNHTDVQQLNELKAAWLNCVIACKKAKVFSFAPPALVVSFATLNAFPDTAQIDALLSRTESKIDSTLIGVLFMEFRGLIAYEYLLFGNSKGDNQLIMQQFEDYDTGMRRLDYLLSIAQVVHRSANAIIQKWSIGGDGYVKDFVQADGPGAGGSVGALYEALDRQIELVRSARLGTPLGVFDNNVPQLNKVDGRWSNYSKFLLEADIEAIVDLYASQPYYSDVPALGNEGLQSLIASGGANVGKVNLSAEMDSKLFRLSEILNDVTGPIDVMIAERPEPVHKLYQEVESLSRLYKSDVKVALGL